jgi:dephospho-CoA kinase
VLIGITGKMGSGKSSLANLFEGWGATVISADRLGWQVLDVPEVKERLVRQFGDDILDSHGRVDRRALGEKAFRDRKSVDSLNSAVHPMLLKLLKSEMKTAEENSRLVVVDAALIVEWGITEWFDCVIAVVCPEDMKVKRLLESGMSIESARERLACQIDDAERRRQSDFVVDNSEGPDDLERRARVLFNRLQSAARGESKGG